MQGTNIRNADDAPSVDYWQVVKNRYGVILLTFLLVFMTAAVITSVVPRKYESSSVVQVHPSVLLMTPFLGGSQTAPGSTMTARYMENEFETITAPETLAEAAQNIELPRRWGLDMDFVIQTLENVVETTPVRGTDFIEITVTHANPEDAKEIAEAVSRAYIERRNSTEE
ncbi:MAG: hypothetical protein ISR39_08440, partial [Akkermansiaceae bacterium]|nr:hypothetical protein [Akkermansiaceae bacterium]